MTAAAYLGGDHECPKKDKKELIFTIHNTCSDDEVKVVTVEVPHIGGPIVTASPNVNVEGKPAARCGDATVCKGTGTRDIIVTGPATVFINGRLAAMVGSIVVHKGNKVVDGCARVFYDDTMAGATFGDSAAATAACLEATKSRVKGKESFKKWLDEPNADRDEWLKNHPDKTVDDYLKENPDKAPQLNTQQNKPKNCGLETTRQLCIQKCQEDPSSKACDACKKNEDEWYKDYLSNEKNGEAFNEDVKDRNKQIEADNDRTWVDVRMKAREQDGDARAGESTFDPDDTTWHPYEGQKVLVPGKKDGKKTNWAYHIQKREEDKWPKSQEEIDKAAKDGEIGSTNTARENVLREECGIESTQGPSHPSAIGEQVANGKTVIAPVDVGALDGNPPGGAHVVTVSQMEYDEKGNLKKVIVNDTASENGCGKEVSGKNFENAFLNDRKANYV